MTRGGIEALRDQLWAEASRHGLGRAADVLIVADGAVWIWNLARDRFPQARQRLDAYHAKQHLWAVAEALHGAGTPAARAWVEPLLAKLDRSEADAVITDLREVLATLEAARQSIVQREINSFDSHRQRMDYADGRRRGEPIGSGAIESTCRQYQCRFKRPGQFWSQTGDEALKCLETFWRNARWNRLFPHVGNFDPSKNSDAPPSPLRTGASRRQNLRFGPCILRARLIFPGCILHAQRDSFLPRAVVLLSKLIKRSTLGGH